LFYSITHSIFDTKQEEKTMAELKQQNVETSESGSSQVTDEEVEKFRPQVPEWTIIERDGVKHLERVFTFKDFVTALDFTNKVGAVAEQESHHPALLTEWGRVGVAWWSHSVNGLHRNDFIMAAKTDEIYAQFAK
jgi:4a-hydroxytetrahydrobiopterin dehydratase